MTPETFAKGNLTVTGHQFRHALAGRRNLSYKEAKKAAAIIGTEIDVWLDLSRQAERQVAWQKFLSCVNGATI